MLTIFSMYIPESAVNRRVSPCRVTLHFVSSITDTESKAVHEERRFSTAAGRQSSEVHLSVGLLSACLLACLWQRVCGWRQQSLHGCVKYFIEHLFRALVSRREENRDWIKSLGKTREGKQYKTLLQYKIDFICSGSTIWQKYKSKDYIIISAEENVYTSLSNKLQCTQCFPIITWNQQRG